MSDEITPRDPLKEMGFDGPTPSVADRFPDFFELAPIPCAVNDADGRYLAVNRFFESLLGFRREELLGRTPIELGIVVEPESFLKSAALLRQGMDLRDYEMQYRSATGEVRVGLFSGRFVEHTGKQVLLTAVVDITERRQAEERLETAHAHVEALVEDRTVKLSAALESLRASEMRFRTLFESAAVGIALLGLDGRPLAVNPALSTMLGYSQEELCAMTFREFTHPEDLAADEQLYQEMLSGRLHHYQVDKRYVRSTGETLWSQLTISVVHDNQRRPLYAVAMLEDIHSRKEAEARILELLQSEEKRAAELDATIGAIADGVLICTPSGEIVRCNEAALELFGHPFEKLCGPLNDWLDLVRLEDSAGKRIALTETATYRAAVFGEMSRGRIQRIVRGDGALRYVNTSAAPILTSNGTNLGAVTTYTDITELREIQQSQADLLHVVSHDLRVPLAAIAGHTSILEENLAECGYAAAASPSIVAIGRSVGRISAMIDDLAEMAALESTQVAVDLADIALQDYLPELLARLRDALPVHRVQAPMPDDLPLVRADYDLLERVLVNLLTNALKYSEPKTPVRVAAHLNESEFVVSVTDQGRGIAPEHLTSIFERFYRVRSSERSEGLGLGLYIARLLVEAQCGRIWVESQVGKGSTFFFALPVSQATETSQGPVSPLCP